MCNFLLSPYFNRSNPIWRRAEQELGHWVSVVRWKSGDLGSFPGYPADMASDILCLSFLLCKKCVFTCQDTFRIGSGEEILLSETGNVSIRCIWKWHNPYALASNILIPFYFLFHFLVSSILLLLQKKRNTNAACRKRHRYQRSSQRHVTISFPQLFLLCLLYFAASFALSLLEGSGRASSSDR